MKWCRKCSVDVRCNVIILAGHPQEKLKVFNQSKVEGLLNEILQDVAAAANKLEADLNEHVFDNAMLNPDLVSESFKLCM